MLASICPCAQKKPPLLLAWSAHHTDFLSVFTLSLAPVQSLLAHVAFYKCLLLQDAFADVSIFCPAFSSVFHVHVFPTGAVLSPPFPETVQSQLLGRKLQLQASAVSWLLICVPARSGQSVTKRMTQSVLSRKHAVMGMHTEYTNAFLFNNRSSI